MGFDDFVNNLSRVLAAVDGIHCFDDHLDEAVHVVVVGDDQVDISVLELQSDTLPGVEGSLSINDVANIHAVHLLSEHPKSTGQAPINYSDNFIQLSAAT